MATLHKRKSNSGRGYTWYKRGYRYGKRYWKSTGTSDKKLAEEIRQKIEVEDQRIKEGLPLPEKIKPVSLEKFVEIYIADRVDRLAPRTVQTDQQKLRLFIDYIGDRKTLVSSITRRDVERFREWRLKSVAPGTVNISLTALRAAFQWAFVHSYTEQNPFALKGLKIRIDKVIPKALRPREIDAFLSAVDDKHKPIFDFFLMTGCRRSEIANLTWSDVDFESKEIIFRRTKGKKDRAVPITLELAHLLHSIPRTDQHVFPYGPSWFSHLFRIYRRKAGLGDHLSLHSLRHTSATELLRSGVSIYTVQKLLGHSSINVTERYLHAIPEDLREAAEILSKRTKISVTG